MERRRNERELRTHFLYALGALALSAAASGCVNADIEFTSLDGSTAIQEPSSPFGILAPPANTVTNSTLTLTGTCYTGQSVILGGSGLGGTFMASCG